ncbi:MAG: hypothetical protein L0L12_03560 [Corynebacterium casei]|uniref:hypothetical protein n=2 Tax=Corynebacterium casei TaxID=160386 RepID=UPI001865FC42|nr:hypothetical protein [Corynebacterium casei]MDN5728972.1 hypothetical protein [Corynebacterium casei]MDN5740152.1 hypothetical protein [Corynebacterium casei]MDN5798577.1 hypothetical protein [Corynebacterium casei]MDN5840052.1 hypothetical protein [Corynebacterium casei]MDN5883613.1 hypothetical protein [Corynebacterium casei]
MKIDNHSNAPRREGILSDFTITLRWAALMIVLCLLYVLVLKPALREEPYLEALKATWQESGMRLGVSIGVVLLVTVIAYVIIRIRNSRNSHGNDTGN